MSYQPTKLTSEIEEFLILNYKNFNKEDLARKYQVNMTTIGRWAKKLQLTKKYTKHPEKIILKGKNSLCSLHLKLELRILKK